MRRTRPDETVLCVHPYLHMQLARAIIAERLRDANAHQLRPRRWRRHAPFAPTATINHPDPDQERPCPYEPIGAGSTRRTETQNAVMTTLASPTPR